MEASIGYRLPIGTLIEIYQLTFSETNCTNNNMSKFLGFVIIYLLSIRYHQLIRSTGPETNSAPTSSERNVWFHNAGVTSISNQPGIVQYKHGSYNNLSESKNINISSNNEQPTQDEEANGLEKCNFGGLTMRIAASPQPPLVNCFQNYYGEWLCNGSNVEVINLISQRLNFKTEWVVLADNLQNVITESNVVKHDKSEESMSKSSFNYSGVIGLVSSGGALMGANGLMATADRQKHSLLLSEPFDAFKLHFLLSKTVRDHDHIFIKPFSSAAWLAILFSGLFMLLVFYVINSTSFHYVLDDDKFLAKQVPLFRCLYYYTTRIIFSRNSCSERRKSGRFLGGALGFISNQCFSPMRLWRRFRTSQIWSDSSSSMSFKQEVEQMVSSEGVSPFKTEFVSLRIEERRRMKAVSKQWASERRRARRLSRAQHKSGFFKVPYILWYIVGSFANQGGETEDLPGASSTRILVAFWWLYLIVICSIHSGILTAILTFPKQLDFIQTLEDYLAMSEFDRASMKLTVNKGSETGNLLSSPDNLHKSTLQQLLVNSKDVSQETARSTNNSSLLVFKNDVVQLDFARHRPKILDEIRQGRAAYLDEKATINLIITQEFFDHKPPKCEFKTSRFPIDIVPMSLILNEKLLQRAKGDCLKVINRLLTNIMQTGLAQKWRRKYESSGNDCLNSVVINAGDVSKIELRHVILAFWLLAGGLLLGLKSLIVEIFWLFAIDADEDDEDTQRDKQLTEGSTTRNIMSSSSSSSSDTTSGIFGSSTSDTSDEHDPDQLRLGHRARILQTRPIKSIKNGGKDISLKKTLKKTKKRGSKFLAKKVPAMPPMVLDQKVTFNMLPINQGISEISENQIAIPDIRELSVALKLERKHKKAAKIAERRARRIQRTLKMVKRLHDGKIYSNSLKIKPSIYTKIQA